MAVATEPEKIAAESKENIAAQNASLSRRLTLTALATLLGIVGAAIGLAFDLHPTWRPDPGTQLDAMMTAGPVETHVTLGDYLHRIGKQPTERQWRARNVWGDVVYVRQQTEGLKHQSSTLTWYLHDKKVGRRLAWPSGTVVPHMKKRSSTPSDTIVVRAWVQPPTIRGSYFLRFELSAKGVLLAIADSPSFDYCRDEGCGAPSRKARNQH